MEIMVYHFIEMIWYFDKNDISNRSGQDSNLNFLCFAEAFFVEKENLLDYLELFNKDIFTV